jgi:ABC-2 type transport system ATP-binding protein
MTVQWAASTVLKVSGFSKRFRRFKALEHVGFELRAGEILGLIGPNGAGKTTLFECLAGVLPSDGGLLQVAGRQIVPEERTSLLFYLPDGIAPWSAEPVRWILDFTVGFFGGNGSLRGELIDQLDLTRLLHQPLGTLSKGQRKRVLLAIGLMTPHPILLADEPFDGLDLRQTREVGAILRAHASKGRTLFLSIHQIGDAARVCDRFVLLSGGHVCGEGTLEEVSALAAERTGTNSADLEEVFLALT